MKSTKVSSDNYVLRLDIGESLPDTIIQFCEKNKIVTAKLSAIGALREIRLAYYDIKRMRYLEHFYEKHHELVSLTGNIALKDGKPFVHAHAIVAGSDNKCYGGHLVGAVVSATVEAYIESGGKLRRKKDNKTGLYLLEPAGDLHAKR